MSTSVDRRPLPTDGPTTGRDELDDLFNYDIDDENDPFSENYVDKNSKAKGAANQASIGINDSTLGLEKEVEVTQKPRVPRVKLDEHRLLSAAGIPKLRKRAKDHLKFKGKGHEYSDATRLLQFYQLWLDDLFPKARFLDALTMVEKMGHKKMMQNARMDWINEGKPRSSVHEESLFDEPEIPTREDGEREKTAPKIASIFEKPTAERPKTPDIDDDVDMEDLYGASPRPTKKQPAPEVSQTGSIFGGGSTSIFGPGKATVANGADDEFPEDDLDALLAESEMEITSMMLQPAELTSKAAAVEQDFDDEEAAMAEMGW